MISKQTKARAKAKVAAVIASVAGKDVREKVAKRIVEASDAALVKVGAAARKRRDEARQQPDGAQVHVLLETAADGNQQAP